MNNGRTIVVGDIHGCLDEFKNLLNCLEIQASDQLVLVGDLMDKGPQPAELVRFARESGVLMVIGNHESKHVRWRRHEDKKRANPTYINPMSPFGPDKAAQNAMLSDEDVTWLASLPVALEVAHNWVVVHGGLLPGKSLAAQLNNKQARDEMMRLRWINEEGEHVPVEYDEEGAPTVPEGVHHWTTRYDGDHNVIYGHEAHSLSKPRIDHQAQTTCFGIDTGVVHGGHLTALVGNTEEMSQSRQAHVEFVQVKARKVYRSPPCFIPA